MEGCIEIASIFNFFGLACIVPMFLFGTLILSVLGYTAHKEGLGSRDLPFVGTVASLSVLLMWACSCYMYLFML